VRRADNLATFMFRLSRNLGASKSWSPQSLLRPVMGLFDIHKGPSGSGYLSRYSDSLRTGRSGDRIPVEARFSTPVQTGHGAHPASYTMGTGSFLGVKRPGRGVEAPWSNAEVKERVELYIYSFSWVFVAYSRVNLTVTLHKVSMCFFTHRPTASSK